MQMQASIKIRSDVIIAVLKAIVCFYTNIKLPHRGGAILFPKVEQVKLLRGVRQESLGKFFLLSIFCKETESCWCIIYILVISWCILQNEHIFSWTRDLYINCHFAVIRNSADSIQSSHLWMCAARRRQSEWKNFIITKLFFFEIYCWC